MNHGGRVFMVLAVAVALVAAGCDGGMAAPTDGAAPLDAGPDGAVRGPEPPAPPELTPCASGWREAGSDPTTCAPWPESGRPECTGAEAHFPGQPGCTAIGSSCPTGDFPDDAEDGAIYVLAGAEGGDGSRASPYSSLSVAVARAAIGAIIHIGPGTYDGELSLFRPVTLRGACPARTVLTASTPGPNGFVVAARGVEVTLENLSIRDAESGGIYSDAAAVHLDDVLVENNRYIGVVASWEGSLDMTNLIVRGTRPDSDGAFGRGVDIEGGATAEIRNAAIENNHSEAVYISDEGSRLLIEDSALVGTRAQESDRDFGTGLAVMRGAQAEARRVVVSDNTAAAVAVLFAGSNLLLEDSFIDRTAPREYDNLSGFGLAAQGRAQVEVRRTLIEANAGAGIFVQGAMVALEDVVVRDTTGLPSGEYGRGIQIQSVATATLSRVLIERNREVGLQVTDRSILTGQDVIVRDMRADVATSQSARGLGAEDGSTIDLIRASVTGVQEVGVGVYGEGSAITLDQFEMTDIQRADCAETTCIEFAAGIGLGAYLGGALDLHAFQISDAALCGAQIATRGSIDLASGEIASSTIGVCIQVDGYDVGRLMQDVVYRDNGNNLDTVSLPVPEPASPLDG